jgi:hypothetical protein
MKGMSKRPFTIVLVLQVFVHFLSNIFLSDTVYLRSGS